MTESAAPVRRSREAVRQAWVERLARFAAAGLSPAPFCAAEGVSVASFYVWKRRLTAPAGHDTTPAPRLLPVRLTSAAAPVELVLPSGLVLRVPPEADPATLAALLRLLGLPPC
jgi:hypothetical protein